MKKYVTVLCFVMILLLCSCSSSSNTSGYTYELTSNSWSAELDGGGRVKLNFEDDNACIEIINTDLDCKIEGKYIADDNLFVIFMPEISQNYTFDYVSKGKVLELGYNGNVIELKADN